MEKVLLDCFLNNVIIKKKLEKEIDKFVDKFVDDGHFLEWQNGLRQYFWFVFKIDQYEKLIKVNKLSSIDEVEIDRVGIGDKEDDVLYSNVSDYIPYLRKEFSKFRNSEYYLKSKDDIDSFLVNLLYKYYKGRMMYFKSLIKSGKKYDESGYTECKEYYDYIRLNYRSILEKL